ncbi:MAG: type II toxin-antitoxin system RelE/ParE family toxin [bacterium]|nr:type II toxin-antitoxin system RelE/ParE family toxin [bacterium]
MYTIEIKKQVEKDLKKIDRQHINTILEKIESLQENPFPQSSTKLVNTETTYRLRVGDYRVIYQVDEKNEEITIFYIRHRKEAYK